MTIRTTSLPPMPRSGRARRWAGYARGLLVAACLTVAICTGCRESGDRDDPPPSAAAADSVAVPVAGVPVRVDTVAVAALDVVVSAPGRTEALRRDRIRAPFSGRLVALEVADGDRVVAGNAVAEIVSRDSEAALRGARDMLASARTARDSADAERAVELARRNLVRRTLSAPADGVVLSHGAETGDYVDEGEVLATVAEAGAVVFEAQVSQGDLSSVRPGQQATVALPAVAHPLGAVVHAVLPTAASDDLSAPVRLDLVDAPADLAVGLFGTARIVTGRRENVPVVPAGAVLTDDVDGVSRIAVVANGAARWLRVETGARVDGRVEILSPPLDAGAVVIVDGQVGLPDGAAVRIER